MLLYVYLDIESIQWLFRVRWFDKKYSVVVNGYGVCLEGDKNILKLDFNDVGIFV